MAQKVIDTTTNNGSYIGDPAKTAFGKINDNFTEIFSNGYRRDNIVGAVSRSGSTPTGAIIERGSNSSGNYTRYADGTQECWSTPSFTASANRANGYSLGFAAAFADTPSVTVKMSADNSGGRVEGIEALNSSYVSGFITNNTSSDMTGLLMMRAVGRWY